MDLSPVWISLKTSVVSIIITFFSGALGSTGRCVRPFPKSKSMAGWIADTAARTASDRSRIFLALSVWSKKTGRYLFRKSISL